MNRPALIKMIQLGRRRLGWDDDTYRDWMQKQVGKRSSTECTDRELSHLVTYLQDVGVVNKKPERVPASAGSLCNSACGGTLARFGTWPRARAWAAAAR